MPRGLPGARETWVQAAVPLLQPPVVPGGRGSLSSYSSPVELPVAHTLPPKPLNNGPFLPCLGMETGTKALRGSRNAGGRTQAPSAGEARGKEGHVQPGLPNTAPSVLPCSGGEPGGSRQTNGASIHPKAGSPVGWAPSGVGASTPSPLRRWFSVPEPDLGILS